MMSSKCKRFVNFILPGLIWLYLGSFVQGDPTKDIMSALQAAQANLRISEATWERVASELECLKKSGQASQQVINDYETYLKRIQAMTDENRRVLRQMKLAYARRFPSEKSKNQDTARDAEPLFNPPITEEQVVDEVTALDQQLNLSLAKFDEMLLKEFDAIRAKSASTMRDLSEEAAEVANRLKGQGIDIDSSDSQPPFNTEERTEAGEAKQEAEKETTDEEPAGNAEEGAPGGQETAGHDSAEGAQPPSHKQDRRHDADDDIVARQLREAAESETDPELKEKLWKEYEAYKKQSR